MTASRSPSDLRLAAIAFCGTLLLALAIPPHGRPALVWVGFAPLVYAARSLAVRPHSPWRAFGIGWVGGLCTGLVGFPWIAFTLERFAELPSALAYAGLFLFAAWTAVPYGIWTLGVARGPQRGVVAYAWMACLWIGVSTLWPALFPYTPVIGLAQAPVWIQGAELLGVAGIETLAILSGAWIADGVRARDVRGRASYFGAAALLVALTWIFGTLRIAALEAQAASARVVRVGIVQPNVPLAWGQSEAKMKRLHDESAAAQRGGAQWVLWPEAGAYPYLVMRPYEFDLPGRRRVLVSHRLPTVLGIPTRAPEDLYEYNSAAALDRDGRVLGVYDKNILVPFGEEIPWVDPEWARSFVPAMAHNLAGTGPGRFELPVRDGEPPLRIAPLICYEDIFWSYTRSVAAQPGGVDLFANLTIDTWFGDTAAPWEHLALAQFRSVEHRIPMVRAVAAGPSSYVDIQGRIAGALPVTDPSEAMMIPAQHLLVDVPIIAGTDVRRTFFARAGWLYGPLCTFVALVGLALGLWRRRGGSHAIQGIRP